MARKKEKIKLVVEGTDKGLSDLVLQSAWLERADLFAGVKVDVLIGTAWVMVIADGPSLARIQRRKGVILGKSQRRI